MPRVRDERAPTTRYKLRPVYGKRHRVREGKAPTDRAATTCINVFITTGLRELGLELQLAAAACARHVSFILDGGMRRQHEMSMSTSDPPSTAATRTPGRGGGASLHTGGAARRGRGRSTRGLDETETGRSTVDQCQSADDDQLCSAYFDDDNHRQQPITSR